MIITMLEAISEMLKNSKEVEVMCAKTMLDKIITSTGKEQVNWGSAASNFRPILPPRIKAHPQPGAVELEMQAMEGKGKVEIVVDSNKRIKGINVIFF